MSSSLSRYYVSIVLFFSIVCGAFGILPLDAAAQVDLRGSTGLERSPELPSSNSAGRAPATYSTGMSGSPELPANNPSGKAPADYRTGFQGSPELGAGSYQPGGNSRVDTYGESGLVTCGIEGNRYTCNWCTFTELINNVVGWLITMLSILAVLIMVFAGFKMVTSGGDKSAWESGKKMLTSVIIGIVVVLAAWLIVDTILKVVTDRGGIDAWLHLGGCGGQYTPVRSMRIGVSSGGAMVVTGGGGQLTSIRNNGDGTVSINGVSYSEEEAAERLEDMGIDPSTLDEDTSVVVNEDGEEVVIEDNGDGTITIDGETYSDEQAREILEDQGISVWESAPGRTQFGGINTETIDEVVRLQEECGCEIIVTGGTEHGHAGGTYSHENGFKIDLEDSAGLTNHITSTYAYTGTRSDGAQLYQNGSIQYALEGTHWDITVR